MSDLAKNEDRSEKITDMLHIKSRFHTSSLFINNRNFSLTAVLDESACISCLLSTLQDRQQELLSNKDRASVSGEQTSTSPVRDSAESTAQASDRSENFFDSRDKKTYHNDVEGSFYKHNYRSKRKYSRIHTNFREDSALSDEDNCYYDDPEGALSDGEEYRPEERDLMRSSSEDSGLEETAADTATSGKSIYC